MGQCPPHGVEYSPLTSHCRYDTGTISGILAMPYWLEHFSTQADGKLTASEDSLIVSILSAGTFFGALSASPFGDLLGRRWGLITSCALVFNFGVILQTASTSQPLFIAGRFFAGFGVGLVSALSRSPPFSEDLAWSKLISL